VTDKTNKKIVDDVFAFYQKEKEKEKHG